MAKSRLFYIEMFLFVLGLIYTISVIGLLLLYNSTQCPGGTLSLCQLRNEGLNACGKSTLSSSAECGVFIKSESCFCDECKYCLKDYHRIHCAKSESERLNECHNELTVI